MYIYSYITVFVMLSTSCTFKVSPLLCSKVRSALPVAGTYWGWAATPFWMVGFGGIRWDLKYPHVPWLWILKIHILSVFKLASWIVEPS